MLILTLGENCNCERLFHSLNISNSEGVRVIDTVIRVYSGEAIRSLK
jgi:hypothetical protein